MQFIRVALEERKNIFGAREQSSIDVKGCCTPFNYGEQFPIEVGNQKKHIYIQPPFIYLRYVTMGRFYFRYIGLFIICRKCNQTFHLMSSLLECRWGIWVLVYERDAL